MTSLLTTDHDAAPVRPTGPTVLLLGRTTMVLDTAREELRRNGQPDVRLLSGTSAADAREVFDTEQRVDHVFMGAGLDLEARLEIVRTAFEASQVTTVHLKDAASGPEGFLPFVTSVLTSLHRAP